MYFMVKTFGFALKMLNFVLKMFGFALNMLDVWAFSQLDRRQREENTTKKSGKKKEKSGEKSGKKKGRWRDRGPGEGPTSAKVHFSTSFGLLLACFGLFLTDMGRALD